MPYRSWPRWFLAVLLALSCSCPALAIRRPGQNRMRNPTLREGEMVTPQHHAVQNPTLKETHFLPVVCLSIFNSIFNTMRPDAAISWQARVPRALWELLIGIVAKSANDTSNPPLCLLLCLMTLPTALVDIFIWAPGFAMFASFESCTGGGLFSRKPKICHSDYAKGFGRLFVTVQSLVTGVMYLFAAVASWSIYSENRDSTIARKNAVAMAGALDVDREEWAL